ncbi:ATP-grasp domain-containing protein [Azospirillum sp. A39]|uniref:ATP-grasp domain-containing protein n=1 Tax=Azospirillum sp. A39 TaxID=3462279 RepID=UPI00404546F7
MALPDTIGFLQEVCARRGYRLTILDEHSAYLAAVSDGRSEFLTGAGAVCAYPLNGATAATIANDKAHTALLARRAGIRVPRGEHFFVTPRYRGVRGPGKEIHDAVRYAQALGFPVFVKPNAGSRGAFADVAYDENDLIHQCAAMAPQHPVALVQEVVEGAEYRIVVLDGEALFLYRRTGSVLVGDGVATIGGLLAALNARLHAEGLPPVAAESPFLGRSLRTAGASLDTVLERGRPLEYAARRNVSGGGGVGEFLAAVPAPVAGYARRVAAAVGLRVCGIDVVAAEGLDPAAFTLLEVNANPGLGGVARAGHRAAVLDLWERVCGTWFAEAAR